MTVRAWKPVVVLSLVGVGLVSVATAAPASTAPASAVVFPAGFGTPIYVGGTKVYSPPPATTTTIAATTTSTGVPTSTSTTSTTTAPTSTTTTTVPSTTSSTLPSTSPGCELTQAAFCETFDAPAGNPATRTGDLNPTLWGVSRTRVSGVGVSNDWLTTTLNGATVAPPRDVQIVNGQLVEAISDGGGQAMLAMYPKQPFDIAARTGTATFDVANDSQGIHAAWPEFWWTDQPVPDPKGALTTMSPYARNSFGFALAGQCDGDVAYQVGGPAAYVGVSEMMVTRNYTFTDLNFTNVGCVKKGTAAAMNRFQVKINTTRIEVWGSDGGSTVLHLLAYADYPNLTLTRGVVWLEDVHYNACKFNTQCNHQFTWDNLGFDGPAPYRDLTFDAQDANPNHLGYASGTTVNIPGVYTLQPPTAAAVNFSWYATQTSVPTVSVNGGPAHSTVWPFNGEAYTVRTISVPIDYAELHAGTNTVTFTTPEDSVANINIVLVAAAPVP
jgi:hypothetical protein